MHVELLRHHEVGTQQLDGAPCDDNLLQFVAQNLQNYEFIAPSLDITSVRIEEMQHDHNHSYRMQKVQCLKDWRTANGSKATPLSLMKKLVEAGNTDLAEKIITYVVKPQYQDNHSDIVDISSDEEKRDTDSPNSDDYHTPPGSVTNNTDLDHDFEEICVHEINRINLEATNSSVVHTKTRQELTDDEELKDGSVKQPKRTWKKFFRSWTQGNIIGAASRLI